MLSYASTHHRKIRKKIAVLFEKQNLNQFLTMHRNLEFENYLNPEPVPLRVTFDVDKTNYILEYVFLKRKVKPSYVQLNPVVCLLKKIVSKLDKDLETCSSIPSLAENMEEMVAKPTSSAPDVKKPNPDEAEDLSSSSKVIGIHPYSDFKNSSDVGLLEQFQESYDPKSARVLEPITDEEKLAMLSLIRKFLTYFATVKNDQLYYEIVRTLYHVDADFCWKNLIKVCDNEDPLSPASLSGTLSESTLESCDSSDDQTDPTTSKSTEKKRKHSREESETLPEKMKTP